VEENIPPKRLDFSVLHFISARKIVLFIVTVEKTLNPTVIKGNVKVIAGLK
jgi:hypothetical protein